MRPQRCLLILLLILLPTGPFATTFPVTKTADTNDGSCDPDCSLREAIDAANTNPGADDVPVPAGTYLLTLGQLVVSDDVSIAGVGQSNTIIDGNATDRVFEIQPNVVAQISGVTIQNGSTATSSYGGGGIFAWYYADLTLTDSTVSGNTAASSYGGGVFAGGYVNLALTNSTVSGNTSDDHGGGISTGGLATVNLTNSTVSENASGDDGGGIYVSDDANLNLTNSTVSGNTADDYGGGIYAGQNANLTLTNSTVSGNSAYRGGGGGIRVSYYATMTLTDSTVSGNSVDYHGGGGIHLTDNNTMNLTRSTVSGNTAGASGVGGIQAGFLGTTTLTNSTVSGNTAYGYPGVGGINVFGWYGFETTMNLTNSTVSGNTGASYVGGISAREFVTMNLTNSTVSGNSAGDSGIVGGILSEGGSITNLTNTIMADNGLDNCANRDGEGGFSSLGYNLADDASCSFTAPGDLVVADARLYPLGNFGGPTKTHYLMTGSPAIDAGSANCPPPQIDQRGEVRPFDGDDDGTANCDIGAVEYMPEPHRATAIVAGTAFLGVLYRRRWNTGAHENKTFEKSYVRVL